MKRSILGLIFGGLVFAIGCSSPTSGTSNQYGGYAGYSGCASGICSGSLGAYGTYVHYQGYLNAVNKDVARTLVATQGAWNRDNAGDFVDLVASNASGVPTYTLSINVRGVYLSGIATYVSLNGSPTNGAIELPGTYTGGQAVDLYTAAQPFDGSVSPMLSLDLRVGGISGVHLASTTLYRVQ